MPVEECGNMLILVAALARAQGHAKYAQRYLPLLGKWADYLRAKGLNPERQLCTDDFAGHLAGNTNLSIKAILGLACYARLCEMLNKSAQGTPYRAAAEKMMADWMRLAADGDHYRLAFDRPDTWSQKYNLVWDRILDLSLFPAEVARAEVAHYLTKLQPFGLPLDSRSTYTTIDHALWASMISGDRRASQKVIDTLYRYVNETPDRVPLSDWFYTDTAKQAGFQARSVVGGLFMLLLSDRAVWDKWCSASR
jgi:hypothetical protein